MARTPADTACPFSHTKQSPVVVLPRFGCFLIDAATVVAYDEAELARGVFHFDLDAASARVPQRIGQRFSPDQIQLFLNFGPNWFGGSGHAGFIAHSRAGKI